jgi:hypothetical protein
MAMTGQLEVHLLAQVFALVKKFLSLDLTTGGH